MQQSYVGHVFSLIFSCLLGIGAESVEEQAYHAGHAPFHVTRLHRWDHSGVESMLQAEASWEHTASGGNDVVAEVFPRGGAARHHHKNQYMRNHLSSEPEIEPKSQRKAAAPKHHRRWLRISPAQAVALLQHQKASTEHTKHQQAKSSKAGAASQVQHQVEAAASNQLSAESDFARAEALEQVEYTVNDGFTSASQGSVLQGGRKKFRRKNTNPLHRGMAVTGLTSLSSQYVGPIGVGTVVAPDKCVLSDGQSLQFLDALAEEHRRLACHLENESQVWVVFDTGSTNIWVSSDLCRYGPCINKGRHRYNHTRSATYDWPVGGLELTVQFGTGCIKGPQAKDDFHIGPFTVFNQTFGMIETQNGSVFSEVPFEGILGLAFSSMSANGVQPFFDSIIEQKALVHNEFAFYFSVDSVTANAVFWGGVDPSFYEGPIEYYPVTDPYYWTIELISFKIGNREFRPEGQASDGYERDDEVDPDSEEANADEEVYGVDYGVELDDAGLGAPTRRLRSDGSKPWSAIVDTGTTFFTAEGSMFDEIMAMLLPVKCDEMTDTSHPPLTYTLRSATGKGVDFVLLNHQYMTSGSSEAAAECTPAFMRIDIPKQHGPAMVLGECFLRHYYSVFDRADGDPRHARVGFAKSRHDDAPVSQLMRLTRGQQTFQIPQNESRVPLF